MINKEGIKAAVLTNKIKLISGLIGSIVLIVVIILIAMIFKPNDNGAKISSEKSKENKVVLETTTKNNKETTVEETTTIVSTVAETTTINQNTKPNNTTIAPTTKAVATQQATQAPTTAQTIASTQAPIVVTPPTEAEAVVEKKVIALHQNNPVQTVANPTDEQLMASLVFENVFTGETYTGNQIYNMQWYYTLMIEGNPMSEGGLMLVQNPYGLDLFVGGLSSPESSTLYTPNGTDITLGYYTRDLKYTIHINNAPRQWTEEMLWAERDKVTYTID
jgi:hypothetical protein